MSRENPRQLIRSFPLSAQFATGPITQDKLVPATFGRVRTNFCQTWREDALPSTLDWGKTISYFFPESLACISAAYLQIQLPALSGATYKAFPALYCVEEFRLLSNGVEVSKCNVKDQLRNYLESLDDRQLSTFGEAYLGREDTLSLDARTVMIPICVLPNSAYRTRNGHHNNSHGVFPLRGAKVELQITMSSAGRPSTNKSANPAGSISGLCSILLHEVQMSEPNVDAYSNMAGRYSIVSTRRTPITTSFQHYAVPNAVATWSLNQPVGSIIEVEVLAYVDSAGNADSDEFDGLPQVQPTLFRVTADTEVVRELDGAQRVKAELWTNGFGSKGNSTIDSPGRLCFAVHASESDSIYSGAWNQQNSTTVSYDVRFPSACYYKIVATQYERIKINARGSLESYLD